MISDITYQKSNYQGLYIEHKYESKVHILNHPFAKTMLAKLCQPKTVLPEVNHITSKLYEILMMEVFNHSFCQKSYEIQTRMSEFSDKGAFKSDLLDQSEKLVFVNLARAGTWPSHVCFEMSNALLNPENLRQDHIYINRKTNDKGEVIGENFYGSKIGGGQEDAYVIFPDPMGATGGSLSRCVSHYKDTVQGKAKKYIALHLIITPEYIQRLKQDHPDIEIYALRLDRGNSSQEVLDSIPGTYPEKESGLTEIQYIIPGAGGMGEVLNNSYV